MRMRKERLDTRISAQRAAQVRVLTASTQAAVARTIDEAVPSNLQGELADLKSRLGALEAIP